MLLKGSCKLQTRVVIRPNQQHSTAIANCQSMLGEQADRAGRRERELHGDGARGQASRQLHDDKLYDAALSAGGRKFALGRKKNRRASVPAISAKRPRAAGNRSGDLLPMLLYACVQTTPGTARGQRGRLFFRETTRARLFFRP